MRQRTLVGVTLTGASALALAMVFVNFAFEAAGSVPDLEGCGFLAGSLASLTLIYPLLAAIIAARSAKCLMRKGVDLEVVSRAGAAIGMLGSSLYFGLGILSVSRSAQSSIISPNLWALSIGYVLACAWTGKIGATFRAADAFPFLLRRTEN